MFDRIKRRIQGIEFYRIYYKPLGEQTGWSKYSDTYDGMSAPTPQDRFFDIEDPPKNRIYLCVGIKKDGKWAMDVSGTWKRKWGEDESAGESKAELKKRLEKLEKGATESKIPSKEEIAGLILMDKIEKKMNDGDDIWSVVGSMLNPQSNNSNNNYNPFADTKLEIDGKMPWYMHPAIATTYMQGLPKFAEELSSSFIKGAKKEMAKGEQLPQQLPQQQQYQEEEYVEPATEEPLDIEVQPKSNTIRDILAQRAAEKEAAEKAATAEEGVEAEEEISSEVEATMKRFDAVDAEEETAPKENIKEPTEEEEAIEPQTEEASKKQTLLERARDRIAAKKKISEIPEEEGNAETVPNENIKQRTEPETEEMPDVETEERGITAEEEEATKKKEAMRERMRKAREARVANIKARKEAEREEIEVDA